jgi:hypothetical protein
MPAPGEPGLADHPHLRKPRRLSQWPSYGCPDLFKPFSIWELVDEAEKLMEERRSQ